MPPRIFTQSHFLRHQEPSINQQLPLLLQTISKKPKISSKFQSLQLLKNKKQWYIANLKDAANRLSLSLRTRDTGMFILVYNPMCAINNIVEKNFPRERVSGTIWERTLVRNLTCADFVDGLSPLMVIRLIMKEDIRKLGKPLIHIKYIDLTSVRNAGNPFTGLTSSSNIKNGARWESTWKRNLTLRKIYR